MKQPTAHPTAHWRAPSCCNIISGMKKTKTRWFAAALMAVLLLCASCGGGESSNTEADPNEIHVFAADALRAPLEELCESYEAEHGQITVSLSTGSTQQLQERILAGEPCDLFFSDSQSPMDALEKEGLLAEDSRQDVINDQLVYITLKADETAAKTMADLPKAKHFAIAKAGTPLGNKSRLALIRLGTLDPAADPEQVSAAEIETALNGPTVSEMDTAGDIIEAIEDGSCDCGAVRLSDVCGHEKPLRILEALGYDLTGSMLYPIARISGEGSTADEQAADQLLQYLTGEEASACYDRYLLSTDLSAATGSYRPWQRKPCPCCNNVLPQADAGSGND